MALTRVSGRPVTDLGFVNPSVRSAEEDAVLRRTFVTSSTTAAAAAVVPMLAARPSVGATDVHRLQEHAARLTALDDQHGGHEAVESRALDAARKALALQDKTASERTRARLYSLAAGCVASAAWSCIDARAPERAQQHLERAMTLAGLARDSRTQFRVWGFMSMLADQRGEYINELAAAQASLATGAARRDPLLASLAHARIALGHARLGEHQAAERSTGYAEAALAKAPDIPRPTWIAFYGRGELDGLTAVTLANVGHHEKAEALFYKCVAALRPDQHRNRALYLGHIATEQLAQGEARAAVDTALDVIALPTASVGRTRYLMNRFTTALESAAPGSNAARLWADRPRTAIA
ncbi:hypothetical protein QZH56_36915 (plasmid) [Streptomyces olivoreticuli]|uniref:hypothetical protein n=1 Tax=Streptomyces olivoreticuli TaxID=68246 RepID=UPI00265B4A77|nr:hypothetical protein [Streptomyces olivoreticuli]WKK27836.1 hypothetical protein QZH56_36915 [Streptomyces olivoreticuli]